MKNLNKSNAMFTLVTGASEGIGRAISEYCASLGMNLILVALPGEKLEKTKADLHSKYGVEVVAYGIDLTAYDACHKLVDWIKTNDLPINMLVNNAGFGNSGYFDQNSSDFYTRQIQLNVTTVILLTRMLLGELKKNRPSYILNVGSMAGFLEIPYKTVYTATKSFINTFSQSLREELKTDGIHVSVLCPGPVATNQSNKKHLKKHSWLARLSVTKVETVAKAAIDGLFQNKLKIMPGFFNRFWFYTTRIVPPSLRIRIIGNEFKKQLAPDKPADLPQVEKKEPVDEVVENLK